MKILQVNNVYGEKSTGKLTMQLHRGLLEAGHESLVAYGRGTTVREPGVIRLCPDWYGKLNSLLSRIIGIPYGGCNLSTWRLLRLIRREKPDVVHLQCINGNFVNIYRLIRWLSRNRIRTVLTLHAEFMYTANCGHAFDCVQWQHGCQKCPNLRKATRSWLLDRTACSWKRMKKAFEGFENNCTVVSVSSWTRNRAMKSDILKGFSVQTVFNGVDTDRVFRGGSEAGDDNTVLSVTAHFSPEEHHPKGGWYLLRLAEKMPDVTFLVAGRAERCAGLPSNVRLLGVISDQQELAALYRKAKLLVLTSQRETFSMPCAESLCCGTPVVGFRAGAPEQIALGDYSEFVDFGDLEELEKLVRRWMKKEINRRALAEEAERTYSARTMIRKYLDIYRSVSWN